MSTKLTDREIRECLTALVPGVLLDLQSHMFCCLACAEVVVTKPPYNPVYHEDIMKWAPQLCKRGQSILHRLDMAYKLCKAVLTLIDK